MPAGVAGAVLQQVRERPLELRGVGLDQRDVVIERQAELRRRRDVVDRGPQDLLDRAPVPPRLGGARPPGARGRAADRSAATGAAPRRADAGGQLAPVAVVEPVAGERFGRGEDRGQRRAQVMADRAQQRGLEHVAAAQRARLDDVAEQRVALERGRQQRLQSGTTRSWTRPSVASGRPAGRTSDPIWRGPSRSGNTSRRSSGCARSRLDGGRGQVERAARGARRRRAAPARRSSPRSSVRAISAASAASRPRWSASSARLRAAFASELATIAATRKTASADPVLGRRRR